VLGVVEAPPAVWLEVAVVVARVVETEPEAVTAPSQCQWSP
jgi:hypothetical protein